MKASKKFIIIIACLLALAGGYYILKKTNSNSVADTLSVGNDYKIVGQYDIAGGVMVPFTDTLIHCILKWSGPSVSSLPANIFDSLKNLHRPVFIRLEVHRGNNSKEWDSPADDIIDGKYDDKLAALAKILASFTHTVLLSYNDDMEVPVKEKPWQLQSSPGYITSFRHLSKVIRQHNKNLKLVWSPSGYPGTDEYWPGDDVTDFSSIKLSAIPEVKDGSYPAYPSLTEMIRRKILRLRFSNQPVLIQADSTLQNDISDTIFSALTKIIQRDSNIYHHSLTGSAAVKPKQRAPETVPEYIGVFDLDNALVNEKDINTEHIFIDFKSVEDGEFEKTFAEVIKRGNDAIVTFETWKDKYQEKDSNLLINIIAGKYDSAIKKVYDVISNSGNTVFLRWGHEMEIPVSRYPWQLQDPVNYIHAFRHIANFVNPRPSNVKIVWGPAGDRGSIEWYPGNDVVDYLSIAIYGLPDKDIDDHKMQVSFSSIFEMKNHRLRLIDKPLFITEFGVMGPENYKREWLADAAITIRNHQNLKGISYFNFRDVPEVWGNIETPDWSMSKETFHFFMKKLKKE